MQTNFRNLASIVMILGLMACGVSKDYTYRVSAIPDLDVLKGILTCSKKASEQKLTREAAENTMLVEDKVETKDLQYVDCEGKVTRTEHGPVRAVYKKVTVPPPPSDLSSEFSFAEIENSRTCSVSRADVRDDSALLDEYQLPDGTKIKIDSIFSRVGRSGTVKLSLTDSKFKTFGETNVVDGANVVQIRYYGKCLVYRKDRKEKLGESFNCDKAELLASKDLVIDLKVDRPEVAGSNRIDACIKKPTKP